MSRLATSVNIDISDDTEFEATFIRPEDVGRTNAWIRFDEGAVSVWPESSQAAERLAKAAAEVAAFLREIGR